MGNGAEPLRFAVWGGRRYPKALLRVPFLFVTREKSHSERKRRRKEVFFPSCVPEDAVKRFNTFACLSEGGENDNEFSLPGVCSSRVPVLKTPFSEPEWQDPEFLRKVRGFEGMLRVRKSLEGAGGCASGWLAAENDSGGPQVKPVSGTNKGDVGFSRASSARRAGWSAAENDSEGQQVKPASGANKCDVGFSRASSARRGAGENAPEGHLSARETAHASAGESKGAIELHEVKESVLVTFAATTTAGDRGLLEKSESEFSKNVAECAASSGRSCSAHATAGESDGTIGFCHLSEIEFPSFECIWVCCCCCMCTFACCAWSVCCCFLISISSCARFFIFCRVCCCCTCALHTHA